MRNDFFAAITQLTAEKGLPRDEIVQMVEAAMVSAYKRDFGGDEEIVVRVDPRTGTPQVFAVKQVVEEVTDPVQEITLAEAQAIQAEVNLGDSVRIDVTPSNFGRIGAQAAKQSILQRLREAERDHVYNDFIDREGDIVSGIVRRTESRGLILELGRAEALLPIAEQVSSERLRIGSRVRVLLLEVSRAPRGPLLIASRAHRDFVRRLLELEIPEIYNGTVEIRAIAREPGSRTKVAVFARQTGLDPVGACVGQRGIRIQNVVNEIGGEKIDVVQWHDDPAAMVASALSPARVLSVELSEEDKTAYVVVPHTQLSLAIGKEGQNARLTARLTGWRVDIKSDQQAAEESSPAAPAPDATTVSPGPAAEAGESASDQQAAEESSPAAPAPDATTVPAGSATEAGESASEQSAEQ